QARRPLGEHAAADDAHAGGPLTQPDHHGRSDVCARSVQRARTEQQLVDAPRGATRHHLRLDHALDPLDRERVAAGPADLPPHPPRAATTREGFPPARARRPGAASHHARPAPTKSIAPTTARAPAPTYARLTANPGWSSAWRATPTGVSGESAMAVTTAASPATSATADARTRPKRPSSARTDPSALSPSWSTDSTAAWRAKAWPIRSRATAATTTPRIRSAVACTSRLRSTAEASSLLSATATWLPGLRRSSSRSNAAMPARPRRSLTGMISPASGWARAYSGDSSTSGGMPPEYGAKPPCIATTPTTV